ncbi:hypothetical protein DH2020_018826 [Rehmannia glutinosa]|uniref:Integrase catalytic domain-containing protein n=1 Tax=Rehmannia glutinosa TaxID=99300 RepID=A0ABR0WNK6_REHGL
MALPKAFQVAALIEKLPPNWRDFKNYLKHKRKEMGLEDLIVKLRIEEDNRRIDSKSKFVPMESKANLMEHGSSSNSKKRPNDKGKKPAAGKFQGACYNCGKPNHMAKFAVDQKKKKTKPQSNANVVEERELTDVDMSAVVFEANLVDNPKEWFVDTGATCHVCSDKDAFSSYIPSTGNDCTRFCYLYLLRSKDEALEAFKNYKNEVENQLGSRIKIIRSDRGGKYVAPFEELCTQSGIIHQTIAPYSPRS